MTTEKLNDLRILMGIVFALVSVFLLLVLSKPAEYTCSDGERSESSTIWLKSEKNVVLKIADGTLQAFDLSQCFKR